LAHSDCLGLAEKRRSFPATRNNIINYFGGAVNFGLTQAEAIPYLGILVLIVYMLFASYRIGIFWLWSPLSIIAIIFTYYLLLGPYRAIVAGDTNERLVEMREFYAASFAGGFVSLLSIYLGFIFNQKRGRRIGSHPNQDELLGYYGKWVYLAGFILYAISTKGNVIGMINPLDAEAATDRAGGGFANYLNLSANFMIPGVTLLFAYFMRTGKGFWWFAITLVIALGLYTTLGFRYRLILLLGSVVATYYLTKRTRLSVLVAAGGIFLLISLMGIINLTRQYGRGLDLNELEGENSQSYYESGMSESLIFQTSGAVIEMVPEEYPFVGFQPIWSTLTFPIPRAIFPQKGSADYLFNFLEQLFGPFGKGAAMMSFGEHYLAFGWFGIILGGFLIGWYSKKLWNWFLANQRNPFAIVTYVLTVMYLYVVISRGYLPQVTMLFFFTVFPIFIVLRLVRRRIPRRSRHVRRIVRQVEPAQ
jgi:oligosaccharide repeat unit polymerase